MSVHKNLLFIGCYNGSVYVYNLDSNQLESTLKSHDSGSIVCLQVLTKQVSQVSFSNYFEFKFDFEMMNTNVLPTL